MRKNYPARLISFAFFFVMIILAAAESAFASSDRFPRPEFQGDYQIPANDFGTAREIFLYYIDVAALFLALCVTSYLVFRRRSRRGVMVLMLLSLAYFGFYKNGCICSLGAIQNISAGIFSEYAVPVTVFLIFILPLAFALFFGRVYCSAVCPMGIVQDFVAFGATKKVPPRVSAVLRVIPHVYLGAAILFAAAGAGFPICKLDPFAGVFKFGARSWTALWGAAVIITGVFVARPFCRYMCPYGVLLGWMSLISKYRVKISPDTCINCRLCENACPVDAIRPPTTEPAGEQRERSVARLKTYCALTPLWVVTLALCGWLSADAVSSAHPHVKLLRKIELEQSGAVAAKSLESEALRVDADVVAELRRLSDIAKKNFRWGLTLAGAYLGIVIGAYLIRQSTYRKRERYDVDPMLCVSCGRCYEYCPRHRAQKNKPARAENVKPC